MLWSRQKPNPYVSYTERHRFGMCTPPIAPSSKFKQNAADGCFHRVGDGKGWEPQLLYTAQGCKGPQPFTGDGGGGVLSKPAPPIVFTTTPTMRSKPVPQPVRKTRDPFF